MVSLSWIMGVEFLQWGTAGEFRSSAGLLTNGGRFSVASPLNCLSTVGSKPLELGPVLWGSMLTRWLRSLKTVPFIRGGKRLGSFMRSRLYMPCSQRFKKGMVNGMVDILELSEHFLGEVIMHPWPTLNLSRYFVCFSNLWLILYECINNLTFLWLRWCHADEGDVFQL